MKRILLIGALVAVLAGVGTGIAFTVRGGSGFSPVTARAQFAKFEAQWRAQLQAGARSDPQRRFPSPARSWLKHQLRDAAVLCDCFTAVKIKFLHPLQVAPVVVVEAADEYAFFMRQPAVFDLISKVSPPTHAKRRWAYEGLLLEAVDGAGVPFLASDVFIRGTTYGGSSFWAVPRFARLIPHG